MRVGMSGRDVLGPLTAIGFAIDERRHSRRGMPVEIVGRLPADPDVHPFALG